MSVSKSVSKSLREKKTPLNILADFNNVVFWVVLIFPV